MPLGYQYISSGSNGNRNLVPQTSCDAPLSSLLDPLEGLSVLNYGKLELEGRTQLPALKGVGGACWKSRDLTRKRD